MITTKENLLEKLTELQDDNGRLERMIEKLQYQIKVLQHVFITAGITVKVSGEIKESVVVFDGDFAIFIV